MNLFKKENIMHNTDTFEPIIVIGAGPVGMHFIFSLLNKIPDSTITIFGGEPWQPYNRVKLSSFFAGQVDIDDLYIEKNIENENLIIHNNCSIKKIDSVTNTVTDEFGVTYSYSKLIIATGSTPHIPQVDGIDLDNIFTFRNMSDIEKLLARRTRSRKTAVIGGGVLGIEAAKAMSRQNTEVSIIDHSLFLMSNQLDEKASEILREHILSLGIKVYLSQTVKRFVGEDKVEKILLADGRELEFDTVILATGVKPNIKLAREAHLNIGRGVRVNDVMQTSVNNIYAIGECAEHRGKTYGVVKPGYEQAKVAVNSLQGKKANYKGSMAATQIKVIDIPVFSMGDVDEISPLGLKKEYVYQDKSKGIYRKIIVKTHRIIGAIAVGEWSELGRIQEAIANKRIVAPWVVIKFLKIGNIWPADNSTNINEWPASTVVCNCTGVTRGQLTTEINANEKLTVEQLCSNTGASTVCGGCKPLVAKLLTGTAKTEPAKGAKSIFVLGFLTVLILFLATLLPVIPFSESAKVLWQWDMLWRDNFYKQVSGYSLLAISSVALILSLKKRIKTFKYFTFPSLRVLHIILGFITVVGFAVHSGYRMGSGINYYLALSFITILLVGGMSSLIIAVEHKLDTALAQKIKRNLIWVHILAFWPLPALLAAHIFKSYYF